MSSICRRKAWLRRRLCSCHFGLTFIILTHLATFPTSYRSRRLQKLLPSQYPISWCKILVYPFSRSCVLIMMSFIFVSPVHPFNYYNRSRILTILTCQSCFPCCRSVYTISVCFVVSLYAYDESVILWLPPFLQFFFSICWCLLSLFLLFDLLKARSCPNQIW